MCRRPGQKGARRASARTFARRFHHQDPRKIGRLRRHHRLRSDRRRSFRARHFETLLDIGPDIQPRAVICDKGYASKANRQAARARGIAPVISHKAKEKDKPAFFAPTLYKARARIEQGVGRLKRGSSAWRSDVKRQRETSGLSYPLPLA